jgi:3-dehydroquinate synthase
MTISQPSLPIKSGQGDYQVDFPATLADLTGALLAVPRAVVVADRHLAGLYADALAPLLSTRPVLLLDATEEVKTPAGVVRAWEFFQQADATKQTAVIVIGGGIIQDIGQFAAHNYYRGLRWHYVPTTLLGMADSCIGAKCGINLGAFKNQLGVFHSPARVLICLKFLDTLADTEVRSGYGEILKLLLTRGDPGLFAGLRDEVNARGFRNPRLAEFIRQSLEVKKGVIEEDEYERDLRRILNYGHTFGHALEAITHHAIPHGMAVAWGVDLANYLSLRAGLLPERDFHEIHAFIAAHWGWRLPHPVGAEELVAGTQRDKKIVDGRINLILCERPGALRIVPRSYDAGLLEDVDGYLKNYNVIG